VADARLHELQDQVPAAGRRPPHAQQDRQHRGRRQADLSARWKRSRRCRRKCAPTASCKPWLAKHGLDGLQGLWSRIHVEQGWENALEAALRERLGALEVSRLEMVRAFATMHPRPSWLLQPAASGPARSQGNVLPRLADLLRLHDAGQKALLTRLAARLLHGRQLGRRAGPARPAAPVK
jgi:chromosome segregation protein